jgi:hypothetical protein
MAFGIACVYMLGAFLPWHHLAYACCVVPLLNCFAIFFIPESPTWLKMNNKMHEAEVASNWLKGDDKPVTL